LCLAAVASLGDGCPFLIDNVEYDAGFNDGFARDDWYWQGFDDSYATLEYSPIYYQGSAIPIVETPAYDNGYWDGVWYAYNDGYFVCYDYAFAIGFSEGYDAAFYADYLDFLAQDVHVENDNGGWGDGYNDGFSEGRVFGANDYESGLTFDWLDALLDYRAGTDLYFEEVDVGTGAYGPVMLYEYGTDPLEEKTGATPRAERDEAQPAIQTNVLTKADQAPALSYRPLPSDVQTELDQRPTTTSRSQRPLTLETTWLERITAYRDAIEAGKKAGPTRTANP
jgi:hypothetical protein